MEQKLETLTKLAARKNKITAKEARALISAIAFVFRELMLTSGHDARQVLRIVTKFRDAGRRSPPWKPTSSRVPGRPQDGKDGNRISRWLMEKKHKHYADEVTATLVEVRYYLQALSMDGAPKLPADSIQNRFDWLLEHPIEPGQYLDPIQLMPISLHEIVADARLIQSGHFIPLDRGGKHEPKNAFLMLSRSNQIQGNLTVDELIDLMRKIVKRHEARRVVPKDVAPPDAQI